MGLLYALVVRPGTPYDEPSHFDIVRYYARFAGLPVVGQPGVSYEGYQTPAYYIVSAVLYRIVRFAGQEAAFYTVRIAGLALLIPAIFISYLIARSIFPTNRAIPMTTALFIALNPSVLAIAGSIQNDMLTIVMCIWVTYLSIKWIIEETLSPKHAFILGLLVSLAILTKLTSAFLVVAVPLFMWIRYRRYAIKHIAVFLTTVVLSTGWWFTRNMIVYGDLTGAKAIKPYFQGTASPISLWKPNELLGWLRSIVADLWLPVEYYRNLVRAPFLLEVFVGTLMTLGVIGWFVRLRHRGQPVNAEKSRAAGRFLAIQYILCMGIYAFNTAVYWRLAGRTTLPTLAISAILICGGGIFAFKRFHATGGRFFGGLLCACLLTMNLFILWSVYRLPVFPFHLFT